MNFLIILILSSTMALLGLTNTQAQAEDYASAKEKYDGTVADVQSMWDAVRKASPEFAERFCSNRNGVCVPDWEEFKSPVGGWRLIDPQRCEVDPKPCSLGPRVTQPNQKFTSNPPPEPVWLYSWLPCDVFEKPNNPLVLQCDDVCGCAILRANCAGEWTCSGPHEDTCSCGPAGD